MQQKILLVDDREDNLLSLETVLEPDGYEIVKAGSGRAALKILLSQFDFALILMDIKMPKLNGFETAALIYEREKLKHIPIIFITANSYGEENIFKGYRAGAVDYIYKPVNPGLLRAKVSVFIDLYRKTHQLIAQEQKLKAINKSLENEIHERKMSENKIIELNKQLFGHLDRLETANKDLDRFAFMASHDLQEPLRKILTFSNLVSEKYKTSLDDKAVSYLERIRKAAERMQDLIRDILTFSQVSVEKPSMVNTDLNDLVREVMAEMDASLKEKNARVEIGHLPHLSAHPRLMRSLFFNLIGNSLKYSKTGTPPLIRIYSVNSTPVNEGTETEKYCRIFVEDNGIGFDQKYAEQIFDMFKRLHVNAEFEGTGIGLALCKKIMEKHNGFISALSKINEGSCFIVSLPLLPSELQEAESKKELQN
jgi:signal transduction histidine kinase